MKPFVCAETHVREELLPGKQKSGETEASPPFVIRQGKIEIPSTKRT